MNDVFSIITGLSIHAYIVAAWIFMLSLPARMLFNGLRGKLDLR